MTETPLLPPPDPDPEVTAPAPGPPRRNVVPWLYAIGFIVLASAIIYLWQFPTTSDEPARNEAAIQAVEQRLADTDARLSRLEQRPVADIGKINARLDAVDGRTADVAQLTARLDTLSGRIESLSGRDQTGLDGIKQQISALTARVAAIETSNESTATVSRRLDGVAKLQEASFALATGKPVGDLPGAPDALARYAHAPPPTESELRLRFPQAESAALAAPQPNEDNAPFIDRVWDRAQNLVTVRRGQQTLAGNPASVILTRAQTALDAGDLASAASIVGSLKGPPKDAMASWLADANALLNARAALAQLAAQA